MARESRSSSFSRLISSSFCDEEHGQHAQGEWLGFLELGRTLLSVASLTGAGAIEAAAWVGSLTGVPTSFSVGKVRASSSLSLSSAAGTSRSFASGSAVVEAAGRIASLTFSISDGSGSAATGFDGSGVDSFLISGGGSVAELVGGGRFDLGVCGADLLNDDAGAGGAATGVAPSSSEIKLGWAVLPESHSSAVNAGSDETAGGKMSLDVGAAKRQLKCRRG